MYLVSCDKLVHWYRLTLFHIILLHNPPGLHTFCSAMPLADTCAYMYVSTESLHLTVFCVLPWNWVSQHCHTYITNRDWLMWWHHLQFVFLQDKTIAIYLMVVPIYSMQWWRHERDAPIATIMSHSLCDEPLWPVSLSSISPIVIYCCCGHHGGMTHSPVWR